MPADAKGKCFTINHKQVQPNVNFKIYLTFNFLQVVSPITEYPLNFKGIRD